jgi:dihydrolipoamide dehydrogenase
VAGLTKGVEFLFKKNKVDYIKGTGSFVDEHTVAVNLVNGGEQHVRAKNIIIATGSESTPFPGLEIDEKKVITSTGAIALTEVPKKMTVIGGGIIGLEMVSALPPVLLAPSLTSHRPQFGPASAPRSLSSNSSAKSAAPAWTPKSPNNPKRSFPSKA